MSKRSWSIDSLVIIFSIIVLSQLLTYVVPQGSFAREGYEGNEARQMVVADSFTYSDEASQVKLQPWYFLAAIPEGFAGAQDVIFLIFIAGGVIAVMRRSGAIDAVLQTSVERLGASPWILIAGCLVMFSVGSYTVGLGEEYVPLVPILVTMSLAMRMDAIVAMGMVWIPYGIGWACAGINPFGVVIAQNIAGIPVTSGWAFRLFMMAAFLAVAFHHLYRYAIRVQNSPETSLVAHIDYSAGFEPPADVSMNPRRTGVLLVFAAGIALFVYGASAWGWYINELSALFLGIGILAAAIGGIAPGDTSRTFMRGAAEMTTAALIVGFARSIEVVLSGGQIIDTIINSIASVLTNFGAETASVGMLVVQSICNFFIPSGSGQAFVTMPIMSPLATLTGVPQQTAVLAYQFGDGFTNMIVPTSALVMGALALGKIPYGAWVRFITPLLIKLFALAVVFLIVTVHLGSAFGFHPA